MNYPIDWNSDNNQGKKGAVAVFPGQRVADCFIYRIVFFTGYPDYPQNEHKLFTKMAEQAAKPFLADSFTFGRDLQWIGRLVAVGSHPG
ncbi:MAG: hypothetical protein ACH255_06830 [Candidatus Thiodiazotropha sp.]